MSGVVEAIGSITVNGATYSCPSGSADFDHDGTPDSATDVCVRARDLGLLEAGMLVEVQAATQPDGRRVARSIKTRRTLRAPVTRIDVDANTFSAVGQSIDVDGETRFRVRGSASSASGRDGLLLLGRLLDAARGVLTVNLSALPVGGNRMLATHVDMEPGIDSSDAIELSGLIRVDDTGAVVQFGDLLFQFFADDPGLFARFPDGTCVDARGVFREVGGTGLFFIDPTRLKFEENCGARAAGRRVELQGVVNGYRSPSEPFRLGTQTARVRQACSDTITTNCTDYAPALLADGSKVEIEGSLDARGVLQATKIVAR